MRIFRFLPRTGRGGRAWLRASVTGLACLVATGAQAVAPPTSPTLEPAKYVPTGGLDFRPGPEGLDPVNGTFAPRVPLEVLPARRGFAPELALTYSAERDNGDLGAGWGLAGTSTIERRSATRGVPKMDVSDIFLVDGVELVHLPDGTYRALYDAFTVYTPRYHGGQLSGWRVEAEGVTTLYGQDAPLPGCIPPPSIPIEFDPEAAPSSGVCAGAPLRWHMARQEDDFNNVIDYAWDTLAWGGGSSHRRWLSAIEYNAMGSGDMHRVELGWEQRDDVREGRSDGVPRARSHRLGAVDVFSVRGGVATRTHAYSLRYVYATCDRQSLLSEVVLLGLDASGSPTGRERLLRRFDYADGANGSCASPWSTTPVDVPLLDQYGAPAYLLRDNADREYAYSSTLTDANGDSRPDFLVFRSYCYEPDPTPGTEEGEDGEILGGGNDGGSGPQLPPDAPMIVCTREAEVYLNALDPNDAPSFVRNTGLSEELGDFLSLHQERFELVDFNRDGYVDVALYPVTSFTQGRLMLGGPDGFDHAVYLEPWFLQMSSWIGTHPDHTFADANGDGLPDIVMADRIYWNSGAAPFFDSADVTMVADPMIVTSGGGTEYYRWEASNPPECLDMADGWLVPRSVLGADSLGNLAPPMAVAERISVKEWAWQHTMHADVDGDGILDRVAQVPVLRQSSSDPDLYEFDASTCGVYDRVFLGDGKGGYHDAGYGTGLPAYAQPTIATTGAYHAGGGSTFNVDYDVVAHPTMLGDLDGNGRAELTQAFNVTPGTWDVAGLPHMGFHPTLGFAYGFDVASGSAPPASAITGVPIASAGFINLEPQSGMFAALADIDADGLADGFEYRGQWDLGSYTYDHTNEHSVRWWRNLRPAAQNRLVAVDNARGGATDVAWTTSARGDNHIPINVPVVEEAAGANGRTTYGFAHGAYEDSTFLGFGRSEIASSDGGTKVLRSHRSVVLRGKPVTEELYGADGNLRKLTVHVHRNESTPMWGLDLLVHPWAAAAFSVSPDLPGPLDVAAPYFNPTIRVCTFEFGVAGLPAGTDIDTYLQRCDDFDGEDPAFPQLGLQNHAAARGFWAVVRDRAPIEVAQPGGGFELLALLDDAMNRRIPLETLEQAWEAFPLDDPMFGEQVMTIAAGPASEQPSLEVEDALDTDVDAAVDWAVAAPWLTDPGYRFEVLETSYLHSLNRPQQIRRFRDISTLADTSIENFDYHTLHFYPWARTHNVVTTTHSGGVVLDHRRFDDYLEGEPRRIEHVATDGSSVRTRTRAFGAGGFVDHEEAWGGTDPKDHTIDACGQVARTTDATAEWIETQRDAACRPAQITTSAAPGPSHLREELERNDFGDVVHHVVHDWPNPARETWRAYDYAAPGWAPAEVTWHAEPDGSQTVRKTYLDRHGRVFSTVTCRRDPASVGRTWAGGVGWAHLDEVFPCDEADLLEPIARTWTLRYVDTGRVAFEVGPYDPRSSDPVAYRGWTYDEWGRKTSTRRADGTTTASAYGLGVETHVSPLGIETKILHDTVSVSGYVDGVLRERRSVDPIGRPKTVRDGEGKTTTLTYSVFGQLQSRVSPSVKTWSAGSEVTITPTRTVTYDAGGRPDTITDEDGHTWVLEHDALGRRTKVFGPDGTLVEDVAYTPGAPPARQKVVTDALGVSTTTTLSTLDNPLAVTGIDGTTTHTYDARGRRAASVLPHGEDLLRTFDRFGRLITESAIAGSRVDTSQRFYDIRGNLVQRVDGDGVVTTYAYDLADRLLTTHRGDAGVGPVRRVEQRWYDADGRTAAIELNGHLRTFARDTLGRIETEYVGGDATSHLFSVAREYDGEDRVEVEWNDLGEKTVTTWDALGRATRVARFDGAGALVGERRQWFDGAGHVVRAVDEDGVATETVYDAYQRVFDVLPSAPLGTATTRYAFKQALPTGGAPEYLKVTRTTPVGPGVDETTTEYRDARGRVVYVERPDGSAVKHEYAVGRLDRSVRLRDDGTVHSVKPVGYHTSSTRVSEAWPWLDPADVGACLASPASCPRDRTVVAYTPAGRIATLVDAQGNLTSYAFEPGSGLVEEVVLGGVTSVRTQYDPVFPRRERIELGPAADPIVTTLTYVADTDRLDTVTRERTSTSAIELTDFGYDAVGRVARETFTRGGAVEADTVFAYDAYGNVSTKAMTLDGGAYGATVDWDWQPSGRLGEVTYPSGRRAVYHWSGPVLSRIESVDTTGASRDVAVFADHDLAGRPWKVTGAPGLPQQLITERFFGAEGREEGRAIDGMSAGLREEIFDYDRIGRLEEIDVSEGGAPALVKHYGYTPEDFVTTETVTVAGVATTIDYGYDRAGLRTSETWTTAGVPTPTTLTYAPGNKLATVNGTAIGWDAYGRQVNDQRGQGFEYGLAQQLRAVTLGATTVETNLHDAAGQRVGRKVGSDTHYYLPGLVSGQVLVHVLPSGDVEESVLTPSGSVVARIVSDGTPAGELRPVAMHVTGSPYREASGTDFLERETTAFGAALLTDGGLSSELGFHQMWTSAAEGIHTAGVRAYDPATGRFLSPDPLTFASGPDVNGAADLFRYAGNNPVAMQDANGFKPFAIVDGMAFDDWMYQGVQGADGGSGMGDVIGSFSNSTLVSWTWGDCFLDSCSFKLGYRQGTGNPDVIRTKRPEASEGGNTYEIAGEFEGFGTILPPSVPQGALDAIAERQQERLDEETTEEPSTDDDPPAERPKPAPSPSSDSDEVCEEEPSGEPDWSAPHSESPRGSSGIATGGAPSSDGFGGPTMDEVLSGVSDIVAGLRDQPVGAVAGKIFNNVDEDAIREHAAEAVEALPPDVGGNANVAATLVGDTLERSEASAGLANQLGAAITDQNVPMKTRVMGQAIHGIRRNLSSSDPAVRAMAKRSVQDLTLRLYKSGQPVPFTAEELVNAGFSESFADKHGH